MTKQEPAFFTALRGVLADNQIMTGADVKGRAVSVWDASATQAKAILFPKSTAQVSAILKLCHAHDQKVVTQGGLTGLVQGAVAGPDALIVSLEKMNRIEAVNQADQTMVVQAGAVLETVQNHVRELGLRFPLDLGARGTCTIGGNVATNAGGINVIRYGMMRNLVLGLEAVLADGTILSSMNSMLKNNAGYDLKQLFIGTEGTLGIVTRVVLRLFPQPQTSQCALVAMDRFEAVVSFMNRARSVLGGNLSAFEVMWGPYFAAVTAEGYHHAPMDRSHGYYVIVLAEGADEHTDAARFEQLLQTALEQGELCDAVLPASQAQTQNIWAIREQFDPLFDLGQNFLYDVSLPIADMETYVNGVTETITARWPKAQCHTIGHIGDGNIHFFVAPCTDDAEHAEADAIVYEALKPYQGSISAEHGIGVEKRDWLGVSRSDEEIAVMRLLKAALDPKNILNAGVIVGG